MNRRLFLITSSAALAGCRDATPPPALAPGPTLSDEDRARISSEAEIRRKHLAALEPFRVGSTETRKTPAAPVEMSETIPEMKTQYKAAVRLHPRFGEEPPPDTTKLGGQFLWPYGEKLPVCPTTLIPMTPVLQLRDLDKPPRFEFSPGNDLLQLFWAARDPVGGELAAKIVWRRRVLTANLKLSEFPPNEFAFPSYGPVTCRLMPEWVNELPDWEALRRTDLRLSLEAWKPPLESKLAPNEYYRRFLSTSRGLKVGGHPRNALKAPSCKQCKYALDYMLTIDSSEWTPDDAPRWRPVQEPDDSLGRRAACGLGFSGGTAVEVFICRRCDDWPVRAIVVT